MLHEIRLIAVVRQTNLNQMEALWRNLSNGWLRKLPTFSTSFSPTIPSVRIRCSRSCISFLLPNPEANKKYNKILHYSQQKIKPFCVFLSKSALCPTSLFLPPCRFVSFDKSDKRQDGGAGTTPPPKNQRLFNINRTELLHFRSDGSAVDLLRKNRLLDCHSCADTRRLAAGTY